MSSASLTTAADEEAHSSSQHKDEHQPLKCAPDSAALLLSPQDGPSDAAAAVPSPSTSSSAQSHQSLHIGSGGECSSPASELLRTAERAVSLRLLPPLLLLVTISYLDRTALSFASIQLSQDLQLSSTVYGLGSGAFFLAYAVGQVPSNFVLMRLGGPTWLAVICIAWGVAASCMSLVRGPVSFVLLRMLLGLAESGAIPGTWYYISCWYPADRTTVPYAVIETGITVSQVVAAPIAAGLLMLDGKMALRGWQWVFLLEGVPAVLLGVVIFFWLPASLHTASFLSGTQRAALLKATAAKAVLGAGDAAAGAASSASQAGSSLSGSTRSGCVDVAVDVADSNAFDSGKASEAVRLLHPRALDSAAGVTTGAVATAAAGGGVTAHSRPPRGGSRSVSPAADISGRRRDQGGGLGSGSSSRSRDSAPAPAGWRDVLAVARNRAVLYAGCWRILHDIPGTGVMYYTPLIVQSLLLAAAAASTSGSGSSSPGVAVVLLSSVPYAAASIVHLINAWHSQRVGESKLHIACTWLVGAVALLLLPFVASGALSGRSSSSNNAAGMIGSAGSIAAFVLLTLAHMGVNGANGLQTGLVAGSLPREQKALGLATYNTIACIGAFCGPVLIGVVHDATHSYSLAMGLLGCSLTGAALMVWRFKPSLGGSGR